MCEGSWNVEKPVMGVKFVQNHLPCAFFSPCLIDLGGGHVRLIANEVV